MLRIDKDNCTVTTDDGQAELALLADAFDFVAMGGIEEHAHTLTKRWEQTRLDPSTGLATMHFEVDEYDALEAAIEESGIYIEPSGNDTDEAPDGLVRRRKDSP